MAEELKRTTLIEAKEKGEHDDRFKVDIKWNYKDKNRVGNVKVIKSNDN